MTITTTNGKPFTMTDHADLARLIYRRFGNDMESAAAAWRRMLQNSATVTDFANLVGYPEHTPHCEGDCRCDAQEHDFNSAKNATL